MIIYHQMIPLLWLLLHYISNIFPVFRIFFLVPTDARDGALFTSIINSVDTGMEADELPDPPCYMSGNA
jgi:hypothetical protein